MDEKIAKEEIEKLIKGWQVDTERVKLAENPDTDVKTLNNLAQVKTFRILEALTRNPKLPNETIDILISSPSLDIYISRAVANCENHSSLTLDKLAKQTDDEVTLQCILAHPNVSIDTLIYIATLETIYADHTGKLAAQKRLGEIMDKNIHKLTEKQRNTILISCLK